MPNTKITNSNYDLFERITLEMLNTYAAKNADYGNSFEDSLDEEGLVSARVRLGDKWRRFKQLSKNNDPFVKEESIEDTLLDMANYAVLTIMWLQKKKEEHEAFSSI